MDVNSFTVLQISKNTTLKYYDSQPINENLKIMGGVKKFFRKLYWPVKYLSRLQNMLKYKTLQPPSFPPSLLQIWCTLLDGKIEKLHILCSVSLSFWFVKSRKKVLRNPSDIPFRLIHFISLELRLAMKKRLWVWQFCHREYIYLDESKKTKRNNSEHFIRLMNDSSEWFSKINS